MNNLENILSQILGGETPVPVIAYCLMSTKKTISMFMSTYDCRLNCETCHMPRVALCGEELTIKQFKEKIDHVQDLTCLFFFDNYPYTNESVSDHNDIIKFLKIASDAKRNVCLSSKRNSIPPDIKKYLTIVKYDRGIFDE